MAAKPTAKKAGAPAVAPVETNGGAGTVPHEALARAGAKNLALKHGGQPGGRKTLSGFPVGSPEHDQWLLDRDAERKQITRANERAVQEPPPISPVAGPGPTPADSLVFSQSPAPLDAFVPWTPDMLTDVVEALIDTGEEFCVGMVVKRARKLGIPDKVMEQAQKDARWGDGSKKNLRLGLPAALADALNSAKISAKYRHWIFIGIGVIGIGQNQMVQMRRLELYAKQNPAELQRPQPVEAAKPAEVKK